MELPSQAPRLSFPVGFPICPLKSALSKHLSKFPCDRGADAVGPNVGKKGGRPTQTQKEESSSTPTALGRAAACRQDGALGHLPRVWMPRSSLQMQQGIRLAGLVGGMGKGRSPRSLPSPEQHPKCQGTRGNPTLANLQLQPGPCSPEGQSLEPSPFTALQQGSKCSDS